MNSDEAENFMDRDMNDPLINAEMQELYEIEMAKSIKFAYTMILTVGIENWVNVLPIEGTRKLTILNNMIRWYSEREEYERCAYLLKGTHLISK